MEENVTALACHPQHPNSEGEAGGVCMHSNHSLLAQATIARAQHAPLSSQGTTLGVPR